MPFFFAGSAGAAGAPGCATGFVIMRESSCCAFRMSASYLRITLIVSFTRSSSSDDAFSASSARAQSIVSLMHKIRSLDLKKAPSISETLDWARALLALNAGVLDEDLVKETMNVILKYEADIRKAQQELSRMMTKPTAPAGGAPAPPAERKKGTLH